MRLATIGDTRPALVVDDRIIDISDLVGAEVMALAPKYRMPALIQKLALGQLDLNAAAGRDGILLSDTELSAPLIRPGKILVAMSNFNEGVAGPRGRIGVSMKVPSSVLAPGGTVILPDADAITFHHEAQLAVVIGIGGKNIAASQAMDHVFGYTGAININARGLGFGMGINTDSFDTFTPLGPWIVSKDEAGGPADLRLKLHVNGEVREDYAESDALHTISELIEFASRLSALEPGDVILTGACYQGIGPVQDGDRLSLSITGLGELHASVRDPLRRKWPSSVDRSVANAARDSRLSGTPIPFRTASTPRLS